ncbi:MAG: endonuclease/exonuclease/phosphatase family protein [Acidimicrobiia bacterium]
MPELILATFNTQLGLRARIHRFAEYDVAAVCHELDADVLALQEVWRGPDEPAVLDRLRSAGYQTDELELSGIRRIEGHKPRATAGRPGTISIAVASRYPIVARREIPMGRVWRDPIGPRAALHVELDVGGSAVDVVVLHTSSRLPYGPVQHLRTLRRELPNGSRPAVVAGDCNIWGPVVARVLPEWSRAARGKTWPAHAPHSQIDHILVNRHVTAVESTVIEHHDSDHRPLRATLRFSP